MVRGMNMNEVATIPYFAHEGIVTRMERSNRRLLGILAVAVTALVIETALIITEHNDEEED